MPSSVVITRGVGSVQFHGYQVGTGAITGTVQGYGVVDTSTLTVAPASCNSLAIAADRTWIYVTDTNTSLLANFRYTSTLTAELRDSCNNVVQNGTVVTFTTSLGKLGSDTITKTTLNGLATAVLTSEQLAVGVPTATAYITVTGASCPVSKTTSIAFGRHVYTLTVAANPNEIKAGGNTSTLTADVDDGFSNPTPNGVMVGFTITPTIRASVPYEYVEAEDGSKVTAPGWSVATAGGVTYIHTDTVGTWASWNFTGTAVSFIYHQGPARGEVTVTIDSPSYTRVLDMSGPDAWIEKVITTGLSFASRRITVTVKTAPGGSDTEIDAFRSGTTTSGGAATATATSRTEAGVATIEAAAIGSTITDTALITITAGDPYTLTITPANVSITCCVTSTLQFTVTDRYSNVVGAVASRLVTVCLYCNPGDLVDSWSPQGCSAITTGVGSAEFHGYKAGTGSIEGYVAGFAAQARDTSNLTVSAGSLATLNVTRAPATILADGFDTSIITATVRDSCQNPVCNSVVTFTADFGSFSLPPTTTLSITKTTNCSGVATAALRSGCSSRRVNITVTVDSLTGTTYVDMVGVAWDVQLVANPTSIPAGGYTSNLTATVNDQFGHSVVDGTVVTFTTSLGSLGSSTTTKTTISGIAKAVLTSSNTVGTATITATAGSGSDTVTVTFRAGPPYTVTLQAYPTSLMVGNTSVLTATVTDRGNNRVDDGTVVTFTTNLGNVGSNWVTKTTTTGVATATLTSQVAGTATVTATADSKYGTTNVTFQPGLPYTLTLVAYPITLTVGQNSTLTATVKDQYNNNVANGTFVTFTTNLGNVGSASVTKITTAGVATATLTSQLPGTATITATAAPVSDTVDVTFKVGLPYTVALVAYPTSIPVAGFTSTLTATVKDQFNNNVANGTVVTFTTSLGQVGVGSTWFTKTTSTGVATAILTSGNTAGTAIVTATSDSRVATTTVRFTPLSPYTVTLVAYPIHLTVGQTSTLTATVTDQYNNNVANGTVVTFATTLGRLDGGTVTKTTSSGVAMATLTSQLPGTATLTATADSVSDTVDVTFNPGPPYTVTLTANPTSILVGGFTSTLTITVTDQFNNNVANGTIVTFTTSLGSLNGGTVTKTTASGVATATLTSGNIAGVAAVTATTGSKVVTTTVTFRPDVPYTITLVAYPITLTVGNTSTLTATVKDQYNNNVANGTPVLFETSLGSLGSITVTKPTTSGIAVATLTSQLPGIAAITATADSKVATTTVEFKPGPPYTVTLVAYPMTLTVGNTSSLTATVKDQYNNNVANGTVVTFTTNLGDVGSKLVTKVTTSGVATATLTSQVAGTATITATTDSKYATVNVTFSPGSPNTVTIVAYPTNIPIGGATSGITATVKDLYGNMVANGTGVTFTTDLGSVGSNSVVKTTVNGVANATLTSGLVIGTAHITVTSDSAVGYTQVTFTVGPPYTVTVESWPPTIEVGGNTATITATVRDIGGYAVADGTAVVFTTDLGSLGSNTVTKYTMNGTTVATLTSGLTPGVAHITVTAGSKFGTAIVKVAAGPPFTIGVMAHPTYIPIGGATSRITATVKDRYGNNVTNGTYVDFFTTLGTVLPSSDATTDGMATTTLTSGIIVGTARVNAISGPAEGWVDVVFTVGPPFYINVVADPTSIGLSGQTSNIEATVKDVGGNNVPDGTVVTFTTSLGTLGSDTITRTTASGMATAVLRSGTIAGRAIITGTADSVYDIAEVIFNPGPPYTVTLKAVPPAIPANGVSTSMILANVTDQYGNTVADGTGCSFQTTLGSVWPPYDTTLHGVAETILTSTDSPGLATVTAMCGGKQDTTHVVFYTPFYRLYLPVVFKAYW
jgi:adhesin/invasin